MDSGYAMVYFNPRSREGSDDDFIADSEKEANFNPRSREGSDDKVTLLLCHPLNFNPRSREGSDISDNCNNFRMIRFQSTLPRRERQSSLTEFSCVLMISIHAPAKGATISCPSKVLFCNISIHAPAKGATIVPVIQSNPNTFQSTLPRRERRICYLLHCRRSDFNPRSREGSDLSQSKQSIQRYLFQSTLPRRERRSWMRSQIRVCIISIHAPAKGATQIIWNYWKIYSISIHAPAKGATFLFRYRALGDAISIHAPAKGATSWVFKGGQEKIFQSTLPRRERPRHNFLLLR